MYLLAKSDSSIFKLYVYDVKGGLIAERSIDAGRELAKSIFNYIDDIFKIVNIDYSNLVGVGVYEGPGSFTGLRIGLTVFNTLADSLSIPIASATGESWKNVVVDKLNSGADQKIVLPLYGSPANITVSRK